MPHAHVLRVVVAPLNEDPQMLRQAIRYYNGGNESHFDAAYILSADGLNVDTVGTQQWLPAGPGAPSSRKYRCEL